ncbi:hypothetical protein TorRG33x02_218710 [Trema orientale]|uniref:Uncharacterized protein n=1 Tax=Trema orientale TaxID=63057 RepID=A0A2P5EA19_TREOI|nr:hypothetical protein TorRG33x02_218710 [Trema orientale]
MESLTSFDDLCYKNATQFGIDEVTAADRLPHLYDSSFDKFVGDGTSTRSSSPSRADLAHPRFKWLKRTTIPAFSSRP